MSLRSLEAALILITTAFLGCQGIGATSRASSALEPSAPIRVTASDSAVEKQLAGYLRDVKEWTVDFEVFPKNADDVYLSVPWTTTDDGPTMYVTVDVEPSARSKEDGSVREIRVRIFCVFKYEIDASHPQRAAALEALNTYQNDFWTPRVYLDEDGDLVLESSVNVPGEDFPIHPELVADAIDRMSGAWDGLTPLLAKNGLPMPQNF